MDRVMKMGGDIRTGMGSAAPDGTLGAMRTIAAAPLPAGEHLGGKEAVWYRTLLQGLVGMIVFFGAWQLVSSLKLLNPTFISSPFDVARSGVQLLPKGIFWHDVGVSALEFGVGYSLAAVVGICVGLMLGLSERIDNHTQPLLSALYATPHVAFFPIMIVWFGIGIRSKQALVFLLAVLPIVIAVRSGARVLNSQFTELAKIYQATRLRILGKVILPGCLPSVLNGLRLAVGTGLVGVFVGELYAANAGLGYLAANAGETLDTSVALFALLVFAISGLTLSGIITLCERRYASW